MGADIPFLEDEFSTREGFGFSHREQHVPFSRAEGLLLDVSLEDRGVDAHQRLKVHLQSLDRVLEAPQPEEEVVGMIRSCEEELMMLDVRRIIAASDLSH